MSGAPPISSYGQPSRAVLPATKRRAFSAKSYREPSYRFLWHYHPEWELAFNASGFGTRHVGTSVEQFDAGDLVLLPGNVPHTWFSSPKQKVDTVCTVIHFLPQVWGDAFWKLPEVAEFQTLCHRAQRGIKFTGPGVAEVGRRMQELAQHDSPTMDSLTHVFEIFGLLLNLDAQPLHDAGGDGVGRSSWENPRLDDLLEWLDQRLAEQLSQQDAAERMKMSPTAFSRWFKQSMGCVFHRYLNEIRVAKVCAELTKGKVSITEAAFQAGYNNLSNFNRRFLEVTGLTPKAFREQIQARH